MATLDLLPCRISTDIFLWLNPFNFWYHLALLYSFSILYKQYQHKLVHMWLTLWSVSNHCAFQDNFSDLPAYYDRPVFTFGLWRRRGDLRPLNDGGSSSGGHSKHRAAHFARETKELPPVVRVALAPWSSLGKTITKARRRTSRACQACWAPYHRNAARRPGIVYLKVTILPMNYITYAHRTRVSIYNREAHRSTQYFLWVASSSNSATNSQEHVQSSPSSSFSTGSSLSPLCWCQLLHHLRLHLYSLLPVVASLLAVVSHSCLWHQPLHYLCLNRKVFLHPQLQCLVKYEKN